MHLWKLIAVFFISISLLACSSNSKQIASVSGDGFGGTGSSVELAYEPSGDESGFGGTGVIGTIEAFGSIWVNGLHIHYPENQTYRANIPGDYSLQIGQQVMLQTALNDQRIYSEHIRLYFPIAGEITQIDNQTLIVNQQTVRLTANTQFADSLQEPLRVGDYIIVSGWQTENDWNATRINANPQQLTHYEATPHWPFEFASRGFVIEKPFQQAALIEQLKGRSNNIRWRAGRFSGQNLENPGVLRGNNANKSQGLPPQRPMSMPDRLGSPRAQRNTPSSFPRMGGGLRH